MDDALEPDDPRFDDPMMVRAARAGRLARSRGWGRVWLIVALVLAVMAAVTGIAAIGVVIFFAWAISSFGSNK
jgi:hypothetical protein